MTHPLYEYSRFFNLLKAKQIYLFTYLLFLVHMCACIFTNCLESHSFKESYC